MYDKIDNLSSLEVYLKAGGGEKAIEKQHHSGKLTARERLDKFFDEGTFEELDLHVRHRSTNFGMAKDEIPSDGVITGFGKVNGRTVCVYAQDFTARGGTLGEMHAQKICKIMDMAMKIKAPMVGFIDSGGARIQEGISSLDGYSNIFFRNSASSGVIPQISAIMGPAAGGAVYSPAMTDFIFMVKKSSNMFITGSGVVKTVTGEEIDNETLGGALTHATRSGVAQFALNTDEEVIEEIKHLLSYLPSSNEETGPDMETEDAPDRSVPELNIILPEAANKGYDMKKVMKAILDDGECLEISRQWAQNMIIAFGRMNGRVVGLIGNQPQFLAGCLDINASDKAARFVRFCDAFNIPLITLVDVPGFLPGSHQEFGGIIRHGAKLLWSYAEATVPKITLITRKAYGGAYIAMCSRGLGADYAIAWPQAEIAVMGAEAAADVVFSKEIKAADDPEAKRQEVIENYRETLYNPYVAAGLGYIDAVIKPEETRAKIITALEALESKQEERPWKKHGNIPL